MKKKILLSLVLVSSLVISSYAMTVNTSCGTSYKAQCETCQVV